MFRRLTCLAAFGGLLAWAAAAEQPAPGPHGNLDEPSDNVFKDINDTLRNLKVHLPKTSAPLKQKDLPNRSYLPYQSQEGAGLVPASRAKLCEICGQPLYKHLEEGFICAPPGKKIPQVKQVRVQCPVCGARFLGALPGNLNSLGGVDRDFYAHSVGKCAVYSHVWMCPDCGYAAAFDNLRTTPDANPLTFVENFQNGPDGQPLDAQTKAFVREKLTAPSQKWLIATSGFTPQPEDHFSAFVLQTEIPDWMKYENALQIMPRYKPSHTLMAVMYLQAAHARRRAVCEEVGIPGLNNELQASLGQSIVRMDRQIQGRCLDLRRERGQQIVSVLAETDPEILMRAARDIIKYADVAPAPPAGAPARRYFTSGDMYIVNIRYAGFLDRVGRIAEALKALEQARTYLPTSPAEAPPGSPMAVYVEKQLALLRGVLDDRAECLQKEREYLFKAAHANLAAIASKEVAFTAFNPLAPAGAASGLDPVPTTYLLGEFLRRAEEPAGAAACFAAANEIITRYLSLIEEALQKHPERQTELAARRERWLDQKTWNDEQRALVKAAGAGESSPNAVPDRIRHYDVFAASEPTFEKHLSGVIGQIRQAAGLPAEAGPAAPVVSASPAANPADIPAASVPKAPPAVPAVNQTRKALFEMYYAALLRYRKDHQQNPATLSELVKAGYVHAEQASLNANGKLVCPETGAPVTYFSNWQPGEADSAILVSTKPGLVALYADGTLRPLVTERR